MFRLSAFARIGGFAALLALATIAQAHHSFSATFRADAKITVQGTVTRFSFKNPHILIYFDVTNEDGSVTKWVSEGAAATNMRRRGWSRDSLNPGDVIRITGDSTHDGSPMVSMEGAEIIDPDSGNVVATLGNERPTGYDASTVASIPKLLPDGRPNLTGTWPSNPPGYRGPPRPPPTPFNEAGQAKLEAFTVEHDPQVFCDAPGLIRQVAMTPHPFRITQLDDRVVFDYEEYGGHREVMLVDGPPPEDVRSLLGNSVARYEGDALIIESRNLLSGLGSTQGHFFSDQATVVETYRRIDDLENGSALQLDVVITDPVYLAEPFLWPKTKVYAASHEMIGQDCQEPLRVRTVVNPVMSVFLTSDAPGIGEESVDLAQADAHCAAAAETVGQGDKGWRAYLSDTGAARDRIGGGPWYTAKGELIARSDDELHSDRNNWSPGRIVDQRGHFVGSPSAGLLYCFASGEAQ